MEVSLIVLVSGFFILGVLAFANAFDLRKELRAVCRKDREARWFVRQELFRAWLRTAGWFLLFAGAMVRLFTGDAAGDLIGTIVIGAAIVSFFTDGILGRFERRKILRRR